MAPVFRRRFGPTSRATAPVTIPRCKSEEGEGKDLRSEVKELMAQAGRPTPKKTRYGDKRGDELPAELARRETRLKKIREAKRALEGRANGRRRPRQKPEASRTEG